MIDVQKGTILKIVEEKKIVKGYRGFNAIDIEKEYGIDSRLDEFDPISVRKDPRFIVCATYFENSIPILFAKIIHL